MGCGRVQVNSSLSCNSLAHICNTCYWCFVTLVIHFPPPAWFIFHYLTSLPVSLHLSPSLSPSPSLSLPVSLPLPLPLSIHLSSPWYLCIPSQEEIRFCTAPEVQVSMMFMQCMLDMESIHISGFETVSNYSGYSSSLTYAGRYDGPTEVSHMSHTELSYMELSHRPVLVLCCVDLFTHSH